MNPFHEYLKTKGFTDETIKSLSVEDLAKYQSEYNENKLKSIRDEFKSLGAELKAGMIDKAMFDEKIKELTDSLKELDAKKYNDFIEKYEQIIKDQGAKITKLEEGGGVQGSSASFKSEVEAILDTEEFKDFVESNGKKKASFNLKTVSITDDYTGNSRVFITSRDSRVVDEPQTTRLNIRDLLTVQPADLPFLAFTEVYDWDRSVTTIGENGELTESAFKMREKQVDVKRIGTHVKLSKRMLKSRSFVLGHLTQKLPSLVRYFEDFQFLHGDGQGDNVEGIFKVAQDFTTLINTAVVGAPGSVSSIETYDSGAKTLVNFSADQRIQNGDKITFANSPTAGYNAEFEAVVVGPKQILIDQAFTATATGAITFTVSSPFKDSIASAQEIDVLKVAKTLVTVQEHTATGIVLNPVDATKIETLKGNDEHYIDVTRLENGVLSISGIPVVETTAMPSGRFAVGDWAMAAALGQFTELTLEFSESTAEKLTNTVEAIIQEEVLFPIYNKYMFVTGNFDTAIPAIAV